MMNCYYRSFLIDEIWLDLQDNIFYFPYLWETSHNQPSGRADWTFILGWHPKGLNANTKGLKVSMGLPLLWGLASGSAYFLWLGSFLGLASESVNFIFQPLSKPITLFNLSLNTLA